MGLSNPLNAENSTKHLPLVVADVFDGIDQALRVPHRLPVYHQSLVGAVHQAKRNKGCNVHLIRTLLIWACCDPRFCVKLCDLGWPSGPFGLPPPSSAMSASYSESICLFTYFSLPLLSLSIIEYKGNWLTSMARHTIWANVTSTATLCTYKLICNGLIFRFQPWVLLWLETFTQCTIEPGQLHQLSLAQIILTLRILNCILDNRANSFDCIFDVVLRVGAKFLCYKEFLSSVHTGLNQAAEDFEDTSFPEWVLMEHIKYLDSFYSQLFLNHAYSNRIRPRKWDLY